MLIHLRGDVQTFAIHTLLLIPLAYWDPVKAEVNAKVSQDIITPVGGDPPPGVTRWLSSRSLVEMSGLLQTCPNLTGRCPVQPTHRLHRSRQYAVLTRKKIS